MSKPLSLPYSRTKRTRWTPKRRRIDQWLKEDHTPHFPQQGYDSDSVTKSDTYLYAKPKDNNKKKKTTSPQRVDDIPPQSYKNDYLQALKMSETDLTEAELTGNASRNRSDTYALQERSAEEKEAYPSSQRERRHPPPQAKPRSFVGKLRESMRKRERSATPDYNTQSTAMSVLETLPRNLTERSTSRETSAERRGGEEEEEDPTAHHTDASDEFTIAMIPVSRSRERLDDPHHPPDPKTRDVAKRESRNRPDPRLKKSPDKVGKGSISSLESREDDPDLTVRKSHRLQSSRPPASKDSDVDADADESTLRAASVPRSGADVGSWTPRGEKEDLVPILRAIQTQTSLTSSSDVSTGDEVMGVKSVAVGPSGVNRRTQTSVPRDRGREKHRRKAVTSDQGGAKPGKHPLLSSTSSSETPASVSMEEEFPPERIEPFAKMSQMASNALEREATVPVKFRRRIFEEGPDLPDPAEENALNAQNQQLFYKPAHHRRAQPQVAYSAMDPDQRREAEALDMTRSRQQLLLKQQQEVTSFAQRQHLQQQAQQLVNNACLLAPHNPSSPSPAQARPTTNPLTYIQPSVPQAWTAAPSPYIHPLNPLGVSAFGGAAPGGPGGYYNMNQEQLMQAVRRELKRLQQPEAGTEGES